MTPSTEPTPQEWFEEWREPGEFYCAANKGLGGLYNSSGKFNPPQYLCDAYHAGRFARIWQDDQGPCTVRLVRKDPPDAQLCSGSVCLKIEITMALDKDSRLYLDLQNLRDEQRPKPVTGEELRESAKEAIPRAVRKKADNYRTEGKALTLLVITNGSLSPEEMARLTEPWKNRFQAICLLSMMDVVVAWPKLGVLEGREPS